VHRIGKARALQARLARYWQGLRNACAPLLLAPLVLA